MKEVKTETKVQCKNCYLVHINPWNEQQAWCQATGNGVNPYALRFCTEYRVKMNLNDYIFWDKLLNRWDLKFAALLEQTDPKIELLIKLVVRSWFIPLRKETKNDPI